MSANDPNTPDTSANLTPESAPSDELPPDAVPPREPRRRRFITRRRALIAGLATLSIGLLIAIVAILFIRTGRLDHIIANQIISTFAEYGIRAEIDDFHIAFSPRTVEIRGLKLYDAKTGALLGKIDRVLATVRIENLFALNLHRNIDLETLQVDNPEVWIAFDAQGNSNFRNIHLPPEEQNQRILFSYSTAQATVNNGLIHYGDQLHKLAGEARNLNAAIQPDNPNAPAESPMDRVVLSLSNSTFSFDDQPINDIAIGARARINERGAEVQELNLRSPVAEAQLSGTIDDWRALHYKMNVVSNVNLTQAADFLSAGSDLRGNGKFVGTVEGEGVKYQINGEVQSDSLVAEGVRLQGLNFAGNVAGESTSYEMNGRAVADLLASGDFKINALQLAGKVTGTGTDFRWLGELRAAALRQGNLTIGGLIARDALADARDDLQKINGAVKSISAGSLVLAGSTPARANNLNISGVRFSREAKGALRLTSERASASSVNAAGVKIGGVEARGITAMNPDGTTTRVAVNDMRVASVAASFAQTASINIAGVRLSIAKNGRIEGATNDIGVGAVALNVNGQKGKVEDVRVAHPVFIVEPSGRYRASADLSLGGGVLGSVQLGRAESHATVTNGAVMLDNLRADVMNGEARGQATIAFARGGASQVNLNFNNLDLSKLLALALNRTVPLAAVTNGSVNLSFPSTNFALASGTINANFNGTAGGNANNNSATDNGRTPLTGELALVANRGTFQIERARLQTAASQLNASGQFSLANDSNLQVSVASNDAGELERIASSFGADVLSRYDVDLAGGKLNFNGTVRGRLTEPDVTGNLQLNPLVINNRDLGTLSASIDYTPALFRVSNGRLTQPDGGSAQFSASIPFDGTNTGTIDATLDRVNINNLANAVGANPYLNNVGGAQFKEIGAISGRVQVAGIPNNLSGSADVRVSAGSVQGIPYQQIIARASFDGRTIKIDNFEAQLEQGRIAANGTLSINQVFGQTVFAPDLHLRGENVNLALVNAIAGNSSSLPKLSGTANFTADVSTPLERERAYDVSINAQGSNVRVNGVDAGALSLVGRTENQKFNFQLTTGLLGQPQTITAQVDLSKDQFPTVISTTLTNANLTPLISILLAQYAPNANVRVTGVANGTIRAEGNLESLSLADFTGRAEFTQLNLQVEDVALNAQTPLVIAFSPDEINFENARFVGTGTNIALNGAIALSENGKQNFSADGDLNLRVLDALNPDSFFGGTAHFQMRVVGAYNNPRVTGTANINNASFATLMSDGRLVFNNINGVVRFAEDRAEISSLTGMLGSGHFVVAGGAVLKGFVPTEFRFTFHGDGVSAPLPYGIRGTGDADLVFQRTQQDGQQLEALTGTVVIRHAEYTQDIDLADFISQRMEGGLSLGGGGGGGFGSDINLDVQVSGRDAIFIRNNLADVVGSASLQISGTLADPQISGRFNATRGTVNFRDEHYEVTRAMIDIPSPDADPIINFQGEADIKGYRVIVSLDGTLSQLQTNVRSDPALPQADVVALITTGNLAPNTENSSVFSQAGLGTATSLLADALINAPVERATNRLFGLNRFEIDPLVAGQGGASPTARLTIGRQINRNLSITYSTNVTSDPNPIVAVEYRVSDRLSFIAQYEQRSNSSLRSQNNNFSFEVRLRKRF